MPCLQIKSFFYGFPSQATKICDLNLGLGSRYTTLLPSCPAMCGGFLYLLLTTATHPNFRYFFLSLASHYSVILLVSSVLYQLVLLLFQSLARSPPSVYAVSFVPSAAFVTAFKNSITRASRPSHEVVQSSALDLRALDLPVLNIMSFLVWPPVKMTAPAWGLWSVGWWSAQPPRGQEDRGC